MLKKGNNGVFFAFSDFSFEAVTFFAEYPFIVTVRCWSEGTLLVAADEQDGSMSLRAPGPACLKHLLGLSKLRLLQGRGLSVQQKRLNYLVGVVLFHHAVPIRISVQRDSWMGRFQCHPRV